MFGESAAAPPATPLEPGEVYVNRLEKEKRSFLSDGWEHVSKKKTLFETPGLGACATAATLAELPLLMMESILQWYTFSPVWLP